MREGKIERKSTNLLTVVCSWLESHVEVNKCLPVVEAYSDLAVVEKQCALIQRGLLPQVGVRFSRCEIVAWRVQPV